MADDSGKLIGQVIDERTSKLSNVGPWQLGKILGRGSSGTVRLAHHKITGQVAAVKIMSTEAILNSRMSIDEEGDQTDRLLQSIEREIVIMKLIEHPNVLSLLDVWEAKGLLFVVMEYIDGGELFEYIVERGPLPVPEALHYFQQIMYAVAYCHQFRIAHRDLKPENILLDRENNIKVADFGMAAFVPRDSLLYTSCGSPHYASPEVVSGLAYKGTKSDVWSCGVILYVLMSGSLPFDDEEIRVLLAKVREGQYTIPPNVPWPAQNLIRRMMEKDAERRIEVAEVLNHPFFQSIPPRSTPVLVPTFAHLASIVPQDFGKAPIDNDIMKNMRTLWRNRQDSDIVRAIRNQHDNWEKIAYYLLYEFRMKRLKCIGPGVDGYEPRRGSRDRSRTRSVAKSPERSAEVPLRRPSAPTPSRARSHSVSDNPEVSNRVPSPFCVTAPLTPRKRTKTEPVATSSAETLPEIVIQRATPQKKGATTSTSSLLDYESAYPESPLRLSPCLDNNSRRGKQRASVNTADVAEDVFFQQIAEMLVNMSKCDQEPGRNTARSRKGRVMLTGERGALEIKLPAQEVPPPPTTPVTPAFSGQESFGAEELSSMRPTIRAVQPVRVLKPRNAQDSIRVDKASSLLRVVPSSPAVDKENVAANLTEPQGRARSRTIGAPPSALAKHPHSRNSNMRKKSVRIVTPDGTTLTPVRKRPQSGSTSKNSPRISDNWFSNLFHLKPARHELHSVHDVSSTRSRCVASLRALGVRIESNETQLHTYGGSILRCRLDEVADPSGTMTVSKALKFRVEIRPSTGVHYAAGYLSEIALVLEKGQVANFNAFYERMRRGWEMNVRFRMEGSVEVLSVSDGTGSALPSPALTAGGRYAEV